MYKKTGFTIVELLIVIVVIAILAAISITAYNGIQIRASNTARVNEAKAWQRLFESYKASTGSYPAMAEGGYCPGTGYPNGSDAQPRCRNLDSTSSQSHLESSGTPIRSAIQTIAAIPSGNRTIVKYGTWGLAGPYVLYYSNAYIRIGTWLQGDTCPREMSDYTWTNGAVSDCGVNITK